MPVCSRIVDAQAVGSNPRTAVEIEPGVGVATGDTVVASGVLECRLRNIGVGVAGIADGVGVEGDIDKSGGGASRNNATRKATSTRSA